MAGVALTNDQTVINEVYDAYAQGRMSPEQAAEYEAAVADGTMGVPEGAQVGAQQSQGGQITTDPNVIVEVYNAYASGKMDGATQREYLAAVDSGQMPVPPGVPMGAGGSDLLPGGEGPAPIQIRGSLAGEFSGPIFEGAGAAYRGYSGRGPSVAANILPEGMNPTFRDALGRVIDLPLSALQATGGVMAAAAGGAGDVAETLGMSRNNAKRFGGFFAALPEAFAGNPAGLTRIATAPRIRQQTTRQVANAARADNAEAAIAAGAERGVDVMTSDALPPQTFASRWAQTVGERVPVAGTGAKRAAQFEQRQDAITDVVRMYAPEGAAVDDILPLLSDDLVRSNTEFVQRYNGMKTDVIERLADAGEVDVTRTIGAIDGELARLRGTRNASVDPIIAELEKFRTAVQGQNLGDIELNREILGQAFKNSDQASVKDLGERAIRSIYGPLREDMGDFIRANGNSRDVTRWGVANARLAENIQEVQGTALRTALRSADTKPETVKNLLFSQNRSDVRRLYNRLSPEGRQNARAAVLLRALENAQPGGEISPTRFANNMQKLARQTGVAFSGRDNQTIQGLARVLQATKRADQAAANPPTGAQNLPFIGGAVLTNVMGGVGAAVASAGTIGGIARLYESPAARNTLIAISRARSGSAREASLIREYEQLIAAGAVAGTVTGAQDGSN